MVAWFKTRRIPKLLTCVILVLCFVGFSSYLFAVFSGRVVINLPATGARFSSTANVSTSVSWYDNINNNVYYRLDRRVFRGSVSSNPYDDTCYFLPLSPVSNRSGTATGTLRDGAGSASTTSSSSYCFPSAGYYTFVTTLVFCPRGTSYSVVSDCLRWSSNVVSRATRQFYHY